MLAEHDNWDPGRNRTFEVIRRLIYSQLPLPGWIRSNPGQSLEPMVPSDGIYRSKRRLLGDSLCSLIAEDTRRIVKTIGGFGV
jgi:hypothetical protein